MLKEIINEAILYGVPIKNFRISGEIEVFSEAISECLNDAKKSLTAKEKEIAKQNALINDVSLSNIETDYESKAVLWIEKNIKEHPGNQTVCYYGSLPKQFVKEIIKCLDPTPYKYLEIRASQFIDDHGNTLLHHALNIYRDLQTESEKEAFVELIEVLYRHGVLAHTNNFRNQNAYEYAEINQGEWRTFAGWRLGLLEMEAAFTYSEMQESARRIMCQYSRDSQSCLKSGFFAWLIGFFEDYHNLKATDRSRDLNEVLKEALYDSLIKLDDVFLEKAIIHQKGFTSRGDQSKLFGKLTNEVIIPLRQSKLFALKTDLPCILEFYKEKFVETSAELKRMRKRYDVVTAELKDMRENFSHKVSEIRAVLASAGLLPKSVDEKQDATVSPIGSPLPSAASIELSASTSSASSAAVSTRFSCSFFPKVSGSPSSTGSAPIPIPIPSQKS